MAVGKIRPPLPQDVAEELRRLACRANLDGANLGGVNLDGAHLGAASLIRAYLCGATLVGATIEGATIEGANLVCANLDGANLGGVNLGGANLEGASLVGAKLWLTGGAVATLAHGEARTVAGGRYHALTVLSDRGRLLRFGCVTLPLPEWRAQLRDLCAQHAPARVEHYVAEIGALLDWCEALDRLGGARMNPTEPPLRVLAERAMALANEAHHLSQNIRLAKFPDGREFFAFKAAANAASASHLLGGTYGALANCFGEQESGA